MKKSVFLVSFIIFFILVLLSNNSVAASGRVYVDYIDNFSMSKKIYSEITDYANNMGYTCYGYKNPKNNTMINNMKNSNIYIASGHGEKNLGGVFCCADQTYITGIYNNSNEGMISVNSLPSSSLSNLKLALWYSCNSGKTSTAFGNLVDETISKGAKCAIGWKDTINEDENVEWNKLFFEKVQSETIVEGFRHADYWLEAKMGTAAKNRMQNRYERGNIYQTLY